MDLCAFQSCFWHSSEQYLAKLQPEHLDLDLEFLQFIQFLSLGVVKSAPITNLYGMSFTIRIHSLI